MNVVDLSSFRNSSYEPGALHKRVLWYVCNALFFRTRVPYPSSWKRRLLMLFGAEVGANLVVKPDVNIKYPWFLKLGANVWLGEGVWIDNLARVEVGSNVCISQGAFVLTGNHDYKRPAFDLITSPVVIEDGAWVGARSVICPGVTLATHSVVTVGSVMTRDGDAFTIYAGNPAAPVRKRTVG